jgi:hypothetical protein
MLPEELLKTKKVKKDITLQKLGKYQNRISYYCPHLQSLPIPAGECHKKQVSKKSVATTI